MKRTPLPERELPQYTRGEEIMNMVTHIVGGALGIAACALCPIVAALHHNVYGVISGAIFGFCLLVLYTISSVYHGLSPNVKAKKVFQVLDHCSIFVLIAGTYTPFCLVTLREHSTALGWTIFGVIWGTAAIGVTLNAIDLKKYNVFSMICYLAMGWLIIARFNVLYASVGGGAIALLLIGGICYTVGAVFYGCGRKVRYMHSFFHILCVFGSILHLLCILLYIM